MIYFIFLVISRGTPIPQMLSWSLLVLFVYVVALFGLRRMQFIKVSETDSPSNRIINTTLNFLVTLALAFVAGLSIDTFLLSKQSATNASFFSLQGFGVSGLLSLIILPLCFQFVDLTNWQRLLSVKPDGSMERESLRRNIRKGLLTYAFESPFTWIIFIFLGVLTLAALPHFSFQDLLVDIPKNLITSNNAFEVFMGYVFIVSVLAVMLSTVDSLIMGIIFTFVYDSWPKTRRLLDSHDLPEISKKYGEITNIGRSFGLIAIAIGALLFIVFDNKVKNGGEMFINLLLAFYSAQLSFFPHIFGILFLKKRPSRFWANASMISGATSGIGLGL